MTRMVGASILLAGLAVAALSVKFVLSAKYAREQAEIQRVAQGKLESALKNAGPEAYMDKLRLIRRHSEAFGAYMKAGREAGDHQRNAWVAGALALVLLATGVVGLRSTARFTVGWFFAASGVILAVSFTYFMVKAVQYGALDAKLRPNAERLMREAKAARTTDNLNRLLEAAKPLGEVAGASRRYSRRAWMTGPAGLVTLLIAYLILHRRRPASEKGMVVLRIGQSLWLGTLALGLTLAAPPAGAQEPVATSLRHRTPGQYTQTPFLVFVGLRKNVFECTLLEIPASC